MSTMQLYMLLKLDSIREFIAAFVVLGIVFGVVGGGWYIILNCFYACERNKNSINGQQYLAMLKIAKPFLFIVIPITIFVYSIKVILPSTKEMAVLLVVPKIVNSKSVQEIPQKLLSLSEEWLEELRPKIKEVHK